MIKSSKFDKVKYYYDNELWSKYRVREAVRLGRITAEEYERITGEPYSA